jgi:hypothetical protein
VNVVKDVKPGTVSAARRDIQNFVQKILEKICRQAADQLRCDYYYGLA